MKPAVDIQLLPATYEESEAIEKFLHAYFFPEEPLNASIKRRPELQSIWYIDILKKGLSFKAVNSLADPKDNLAGVVLNTEVSLAEEKDLSTIDDPKKLKIHKLLRKLNEISKTWEVVNNENHFNVLSVSVSSNYRGYGIGQKLVEESLKLAKSLKYKYVTIECSSYYSAKFAVNLGFELIGEIPYEEYLDENKEQIFKVNKPHQAIKKLVKRL